MMTSGYTHPTVICSVSTHPHKVAVKQKVYITLAVKIICTILTEL